MKDTDGYPCEARNIQEGVWFYEQKDGVHLCVAGQSNGVPFGTTVIKIPWRKLSGAVDRHRAIKEAGG